MRRCASGYRYDQPRAPCTGGHPLRRARVESQATGKGPQPRGRIARQDPPRLHPVFRTARRQTIRQEHREAAAGLSKSPRPPSAGTRHARYRESPSLHVPPHAPVRPAPRRACRVRCERVRRPPTRGAASLNAVPETPHLAIPASLPQHQSLVAEPRHVIQPPQRQFRQSSYIQRVRPDAGHAHAAVAGAGIQARQ